MGLLAVSRGGINSLFSQHLHPLVTAKSEWNEIHNTHMSVITFWDRTKVNLLTNVMHAGKLISNSTRTKALPMVLYHYRRWLGSLDHHDRQLHAYYPSYRNIKWHSALLLELLKIAVNNTWILINQLQDQEISLKDVEIAIVKHLTKSNTLRRDFFKPVSAIKYDHFDHWPEETNKGSCVVYLTTEKKSNTSYQCSKCKVKLEGWTVERSAK